MTSTELVPQVGVLSLPEQEQGRILQALGLDIRQPLTKALLLVAERYDLDPLLKQVQIIKSNVYITHAGLLHIAHKSGKLDGIVVEDESVDGSHFRAKVSVYRKDMAHPFTFSGKYAKSKVRSDGASGEEMALKNAERAALRRAFDITAPTMDDSGSDLDEVVPYGDIDLPQGQPALPSAANNALPVPAATTPEGSAMPPPQPVSVGADDPKPVANATRSNSTGPASSAPAASTGATTPASGASAASAPTSEPKIPEGATKVIDPESGEVMYLSKGGAIINTKTGGEVLAATPEQQALQARAREIAAAANAKAEEPAKPARKARVTKKAAAPAEPTHTDEQIKRAQSLHMKAKELDIEESLLRDIVKAITEGATESTRDVSQDQADTVKAIMTAISQDLMDLEYDEQGNLHFEMMDNPLPPDDADPDEGVVDAEVVEEPVNWKQEANSRHISDGTFLRRARAMADEMGLPMPGSYADVTDPKLQASLMEWLKESEE